MAGAFIAVIRLGKPWMVAGVVVLVLFLAAVEYFDRVREKGYQPAFVPGIVACVGAPVAVYLQGIQALPLVIVLAFATAAVSFVGSNGLESNPMPNMAITTLGVTWIGVLGSFGAAIAALTNQHIFTADGSVVHHLGTDTLCLLAVAVVANDVGALFVGSAIGKTPLRAWISPNKSIEGLLGGTIVTLGVMLLIGISKKSHTWNSTGDLLLLGLVVSVTAPLGDLVESMFKRNLDVKDFGSIVKGHGGVLDRFDGFLFTLPAVYYLTVYLQPWFTK
jgi:phosphatidate cytidylyltransferase